MCNLLPSWLKAYQQAALALFASVTVLSSDNQSKTHLWQSVQPSPKKQQGTQRALYSSGL